MFQTIEVVIDASGQIHPLGPPIRLPPGCALLTLLTLLDEQVNESALLAEAALAKDWLKPEEDEAWAHLQPGKS